MARRSTEPLPPGLEKARERFEAWRAGHTGRKRIPEKLWQVAVRAAEKHGAYKTARTLRLDYTGLKRRLPRGEKTPESPSAPTFVELRRADLTPAPECVLWVEDPGGAKLRMEVRGLDAAELGALARSFGVGGR